MALSKSSRIIILLVIDTIFFLIEIVTGYAVHSLALVADSFHMLNDVLSLCVGLWAVKVANTRSNSKMYTYGWQRAETLGALVNGVFLVALCVTIFLDAIQRFVEPQKVKNPQLVLIVGCLGLASNLLGLLLFHEHNHGPGGHSHGHSHADEQSAAEEGHSHSHEGHEHGHSHSEGSQVTAVEDNTVAKRGKRKHSRSGSRYSAIEDLPVAPRDFRKSIIDASHMDPIESEDGSSDNAVEDDHEEHDHSHESPLLGGKQSNYGSLRRKSISHQQHNHRQPKKEEGKGGHGHSHGDLNMRGIFLHVMGDALGNIGVIATALVIWLTDYSWRFYFDPAISLVITVIILCSAIPLCKAASRILLQAVPYGISVDEIKEDVEDLPGIISCHHVHVWQLSDTKLVASLHVQVDFDFKGEGSARYMQLAKAIRQCLHEFGIHSSTIQPEFCLDPEHDHTQSVDGTTEVSPGSTGASARQAGGSVRGSKANSERDACLLDCGDGCAQDKACCGPAGSDKKDAGHKH